MYNVALSGAPMKSPAPLAWSLCTHMGAIVTPQAKPSCCQKIIIPISKCNKMNILNRLVVLWLKGSTHIQELHGWVANNLGRLPFIFNHCSSDRREIWDANPVVTNACTQGRLLAACSFQTTRLQLNSHWRCQSTKSAVKRIIQNYIFCTS